MAKEKLTFSEEQMADLRRVVYGGYKQKPKLKILERGGHRGKMTSGGGIDYNYYSGKKNKYDFYTFGYSPTVDAEEGSTSANFKKISDYLGIKNVDSTKDLQQIYDYVLGYEMPVEEKKEEPKVEPEPEPEVEEEKPVEELPEPEITEEKVKELTPTTPYQIGQLPTTIRNPSKKKVKGGISQFSSSGGGNRALPTIKSKLLNI